MKRNRAFINQLCGYCQKTYSTRRGDHLPDKCLTKRVPNAPRIPACLDCNRKYGNYKDNVRLRFMLTLALESADNVPSEIKAAAFRGVEQGSDRFIAKELKIEPVWIRHNGKVVETALVRQDYEFLVRYTERLVRGFYFFFKDQKFPETHTITTLTAGIIRDGNKDFVDRGLAQLNDPSFTPIRQSIPNFTRKWDHPDIENVFNCTYYGAGDYPSAGYWEFIFYNSLLLGAVVLDPDKETACL